MQIPRVLVDSGASAARTALASSRLEKEKPAELLSSKGNEGKRGEAKEVAVDLKLLDSNNLDTSALSTSFSHLLAQSPYSQSTQMMKSQLSQTIESTDPKLTNTKTQTGPADLGKKISTETLVTTQTMATPLKASPIPLSPDRVAAGQVQPNPLTLAAVQTGESNPLLSKESAPSKANVMSSTDLLSNAKGKLEKGSIVGLGERVNPIGEGSAQGSPISARQSVENTAQGPMSLNDLKVLLSSENQDVQELARNSPENFTVLASQLDGLKSKGEIAQNGKTPAIHQWGGAEYLQIAQALRAPENSSGNSGSLDSGNSQTGGKLPSKEASTLGKLNTDSLMGTQTGTMINPFASTMVQMPGAGRAEKDSTPIMGLGTAQGGMGKTRMSTDSLAKVKDWIQQSQMTTQFHSNGNAEMQIALKPENLGNLRVRLSQVDGKLHLTFNADKAESKAVIEESLGSLREALAKSQIQLASLDVQQGLTHPSSLGSLMNSSGSALGGDNLNSQQNGFNNPSLLDQGRQNAPGQGFAQDYRQGMFGQEPRRDQVGFGLETDNARRRPAPALVSGGYSGSAGGQRTRVDIRV